MNVFFARILIVLCLFSMTPFKEVLKAPLLVMHYIDHRSEMPDMTLGQFFLLHYASDVKIDKDFAQDQQLPFKSLDYQHLPIFIVNETQFVRMPISNILQSTTEKVTNSHYLFFVKDAILSGVFHPPRHIG